MGFYFSILFQFQVSRGLNVCHKCIYDMTFFMFQLGTILIGMPYHTQRFCNKIDGLNGSKGNQSSD